MQFTKLRLNGFKSFVDPTELLIADGLTGVVGPNGCGKSNLLEALRWVMGENRPSAMRGGGMEDVIFAGAASRPARNFAEVVLSLDNSDRTAPSSFNNSDKIDVFRRITRDAGSAYKANGNDVRARDVQMLFADASTGAHSPALVRQGQISELINAKPKARRRILEEAAGISGLYQRRHEAELKLNNAETNLARVDDVLEQLLNQLNQLSRQAKQAARYREIGEQLRQAEGLLLFLRWQNADRARVVAEQELAEKTKLTAAAETSALKARQAREKIDGTLPSLREEEAIAGALLQRLKVAEDQLESRQQQAEQEIASLGDRVVQLKNDIEREDLLNQDAEGAISKLEEEKQSLDEASVDQPDRLEDAEASARNAAVILQKLESDLATETEDLARLSARHQSAQRLVFDASETAERYASEAQKAETSMGDAQKVLKGATEEVKAAQSDVTTAANAAQEAEHELAFAETKRSTLQSQEAEARAKRSEAEGEISALKAEVSGLTKLVERETTEGGQVIDAFQVKSGYEKAMGAALADDLRVPMIEEGESTGWVTLSDYESPQKLADGIVPLTQFVDFPRPLARRMSQVGLVSAQDGSRLQEKLQPGQRLVSTEGDLWRWDGFKISAQQAPSSAALRLEQVNRLEELKSQLETAEIKANNAIAGHEKYVGELKSQTEAELALRETRKQNDTKLADARRQLSKAEGDLSLAEGKLETLQIALSRYQSENEDAMQRLAEAKSSLDDLGDLDGLRETIENSKASVEEARATMISERATYEEIRRSIEAREKRRTEIVGELDQWKSRLSNAEARKEELTGRLEQTQNKLADAEATPDQIAKSKSEIAGDLEKAETRKASASDALRKAETEAHEAEIAERTAERDASTIREERAASNARVEASKQAVEVAVQRIDEVQNTSLEELIKQCAPLVSKGTTLEKTEADLARFVRQRDALGAVNLRAEEDAKEVQQEYENLEKEKSDLETAIGKLRSGIAGLNKEGRERLLRAFDDVNRNFSRLFKHLFNGGEANLVMVESDDPLDAGLEIMCQPPGKKLSTLSLLSGGEQTLTALALIFAVFLANPAPICVLDEVDAPLDDANVTRFCDLLDEMTRQANTRFLIITHHAVTMSRMNRLFGVTMAEQGVSQLVSVDLKEAEAMVA